LLGDPEIAPENPVAWISQLAEVTRAYEAAHQLVQSEDELLGQTMASFGRL
jgi:flagellar basal body rod protein FlgG